MVRWHRQVLRKLLFQEYRKNEIKVGSSDVDINIPEVRTNNDKTFAVIISNENYTMVSKVPMALNDGENFQPLLRKDIRNA